MGLLDIFYQEASRWRDRTLTNKERENALKQSLRKALLKFEFLWEDQITINIYRGERLNTLLRELSEDFLDLAIEVESNLDNNKITKNLREIAKDFMLMANSPRTLNFMEIITKERGKSLNRINVIKEELET